MDDQRLGAAIRAVRMRRNLRQVDVAERAHVSAALVSDMEAGRFARITVQRVRAVCSVLDIRLDLNPRWRGGELDRLLNARHNALGEAVAAMLVDLGWLVLPEVSFSIYGERGVIDLLAWHAPTRTLLVIELKTEIVDPQELLATLGRKSRLAARIGRDHGWSAAVVGTWLVVAESSTNRARFGRFRTMLTAGLPDEPGAMKAWLRSPAGPIAAATFHNFSQGRLMHPFAARRRVRRPHAAQIKRDQGVSDVSARRTSALQSHKASRR